MKKPMLIAIAGVLAGGGLAVGVFMFLNPFGSGGAAEPTPEPTPVVVEGKLGPHIILESRIFNLRSIAGHPPTYLKLETVVEFETTDEAWAKVLHGCVQEAGGSPCKAKEALLLNEFAEEIGTGRTLIEDAVTSIVSSKTIEQISSPEGKEQLREEIEERVARVIPHPHVTRVLFTDFVTQ